MVVSIPQSERDELQQFPKIFKKEINLPSINYWKRKTSTTEQRMDVSSLPEAQKQQLQQQFQEHQQQQKQQEAQRQQQNQNYPQDYASSQQYGSSQIQPQSSYDQSYYSYYQQNPQHSQQSQHPQQYDYYSNAYQQQPQHQEQQISQLELVGHTKPAGISEAPLPAGESGGTALAGLGQVQLQHQQNAYYPQHFGPVGDQLSSGFPGMNPAAAAAVAALSQLTQFAGTMGSAERAMMELQGYGPMMGRGVPGQFMGPGPMHYGGPSVVRPPYRVGGRRGGDPYRRGGHGNFRNRGRGRGLGRGIPGHFSPQNVSSSAHPGTLAAEEVKSTEEIAEPWVPEKGNAAPMQQHIRVAWCELCRVDCNSMEILEQHKNGKKHKKNLQRSEALKKTYQPVANIQSDGKGVADSNPEGKLQPENTQEGEENKLTLPEKIPTESVSDENKAEAEQKHNQVDQPQNPAEGQLSMQTRKPGLNQFDNQRPGMKRKMRGGRGGKRMKTSDAPRRPIKPSKLKVVIPLICDLCNVKCDTQEVFDRHVSGKKHISKLKRFEGHQAMYGPLGLQALYPPNPIAQTLYQPQGPQQTFNGPQGSYPPPGDPITAQVQPAAQAAPGIDSGFQQNPNQLSDGNPESGVQKAQQQSVSVEPVAN